MLSKCKLKCSIWRKESTKYGIVHSFFGLFFFHVGPSREDKDLLNGPVLYIYTFFSLPHFMRTICLKYRIFNFIFCVSQLFRRIEDTLLHIFSAKRNPQRSPLSHEGRSKKPTNIREAKIWLCLNTSEICKEIFSEVWDFPVFPFSPLTNMVNV